MNMQQWEEIKYTFLRIRKTNWKLFLSGPCLGSAFMKGNVMQAFNDFRDICHTW